MVKVNLKKHTDELIAPLLKSVENSLSILVENATQQNILFYDDIKMRNPY